MTKRKRNGGASPARNDKPQERGATAKTQSNVALASLGGLLDVAAQEGQRTQMARLNTGHLVLATLRIEGSLFAGLLHDRGADPAKLTTHVERLARMDEGQGEDPSLTAVVERELAAALARLPDGPPVEQLADVTLWQALAEEHTVAFRLLENAGFQPAELRQRLGRALALEEGAAPKSAGARYRLTPEQYAALSLDGDYKTSAQKKPFRAEVRGGDLHIFSGWRYQKKAFDGEGNSIFFDTERMIREAVEFVRREGEVELGSCAENRIPEPDTFEAFLRQFSISGNLASYIPAILESLGAIRIEKRAGGVHWALPGDRAEAPEQGSETSEG